MIYFDDCIENVCSNGIEVRNEFFFTFSIQSKPIGQDKIAHLSFDDRVRLY